MALPKMTFPTWRDARFLQVAVLAGYAVTARTFFHFERSLQTALLCCLGAILLDLAYGYFKFKKFVFPLSAVIIGLASSLLIYSRSPYPYLGAVTLAISSKALLTYRGKHLFNPANFGVVLLLLLAPRWVTGMPALFSGYLLPSVVFAVLGTITVVYAKQMEVSFSWLFGFLVLAFIRARIAGNNPLLVMLPALGPSFLLFTFHMISDPATTPRTRKYRLSFGFFVAFVDAALRYYQIPYGIFYALFFASCFMPWIREHETT